MSVSITLSSKLPQASQRGFVLRHNRQRAYESGWHRHDCAMLLWARTGALDSYWACASQASTPDMPARVRLTRGAAIFLPPDAAHRTTARTPDQQHGELYLAPELWRGLPAVGAIRLDGCTAAMLDALLAPTLQAAGAEHLVRAVMSQCAHAHAVALVPAGHSLVHRMIERFDAALRQELPLPSIDEVAHELGVSARTLQRQCESEAAATPVLIRRRILARRARHLMQQGQSLAQVSRRLDFANSGHLSRLLKTVAD